MSHEINAVEKLCVLNSTTSEFGYKLLLEMKCLFRNKAA